MSKRWTFFIHIKLRQFTIVRTTDLIEYAEGIQDTKGDRYEKVQLLDRDWEDGLAYVTSELRNKSYQRVIEISINLFFNFFTHRCSNSKLINHKWNYSYQNI